MSRQDYGNGIVEERAPGRWRITLELGRDPRTQKRRRRRFTVRGIRKDAQRALREALQQRDHGVAAAPDKITVGEWVTAWLERHRADGRIGPRAYDRDLHIIRRHLLPSLGNIRLQALRPDHIADVKARWLSGNESTSPAPLSGSTVHKHFVVLRQALADALKAGIIARNPIDAVSAPSVKVRHERRALSEDEITLLLAAAADTRFDAAIRVTLATGLRQGELLGLRWEDVDVESATLRVCRTLSYVDGETVFGSPKTANSRRTVELSETTVQALRSHRVEQAKHRLRLGSIWREHGLVFPSLIGTPWIGRDFYRSYRPVVDASGIGDPASVNWHTLRHTAATQWLHHGADVFSVSRRLGHASASFTMDVYAHLLKGQQRQAAEALDHLLAKA